MKIKQTLSAIIIILASLNSFATEPYSFVKKISYSTNGKNKTYWICSPSDKICNLNVMHNGNPIITDCYTFNIEDMNNKQTPEMIESGCVFENENFYITCFSKYQGMFKAYLKNDIETSIIVQYIQLPDDWKKGVWAYKFELIENGTKINIHAFAIKHKNDTINLDDYFGTNEIASTITVKDIIENLNEKKNEKEGVEYEKKIFSSAEIVVSIFPNPVLKNINFLNISLKMPTGTMFEHSVKIFDENGNLILNEKFVLFENKISVKELKSGIYIVEVLDQTGVSLKKEKIVLN